MMGVCFMVQSYYFFLNWTRNNAIKQFFVKQSFPCAFLNDNFRSTLMCLMCCIPLLCPFLVMSEYINPYFSGRYSFWQFIQEQLL